MGKEGLGVLFGVLGCLFIIGLLVSLVACARVSRRPTANKKAVGAFAVVMTTPLIVGMVGAATRSAEAGAGPGCLLGALMVLGVLGGVLLAILGLVEIKRNPAAWKEGAGWAIGALCVGGLYILIWIGAAAAGVASVVARSEARAPIKAEFPELRFRFDPPAAPWRQLEKGMNPKACVTVGRRGPEMYFMVIGEKIEGEERPSLQALKSIVKANLLSGVAGSKVTLEEPEFIQGQEGIKLLADVPEGGNTLVFRYWLHASEDHVYQLIAWSAKADREAMLAESATIIRGFRVLPKQE